MSPTKNFSAPFRLHIRSEFVTIFETYSRFLSSRHAVGRRAPDCRCEEFVNRPPMRVVSCERCEENVSCRTRAAKERVPSRPINLLYFCLEQSKPEEVLW